MVIVGYVEHSEGTEVGLAKATNFILPPTGLRSYITFVETPVNRDSWISCGKTVKLDSSFSFMDFNISGERDKAWGSCVEKASPE